MSTTNIFKNIQVLPLPLAQLLKRSLNAKSATDRHHNAFYLGEAGLKLAAAARVGVWMAHLHQPQSPLVGRLEKLVRPSLGTWLELLRSLDEELVRPVDAAQLPLGEVAGEAGKGTTPTPALGALVQAAREHEVLQAGGGGFKGLLGFFNVLVAYRNRVMGHGAQRQSEFYELMAPLLLQAALEAFSSRVFLQNHQLAVALTDERGQRRWMALTGLGSLPLAPELVAQLPEVNGQSDEPFLVGPNTAIPLAPLVMVQTVQDQEHVGFLNETVVREKTCEGRNVQTVTRVEYLDYSTGAVCNFGDAQLRLSRFLGRLRGKGELTKEEFEELEHQDPAQEKVVSEPETGTGTYLGEFELLDRLGRGGMGEVYRARHRSLRRVVALKVLPREAGADVVALERFRREYRALWECDHANVVKIYTFGEDKGRYFYTMDYVEGADLGRVQKMLSSWKTSGVSLEGGHLHAAVSTSGGHASSPDAFDPEGIPAAKLEPPPRIERTGDFYLKVARLFAEAADGLAHLHDKKIIHRDIKPANLILTSDARHLILLDLGLAKLVDASRDLTQDFSRQLGTLAYMAPEQLHAQHVKVDHRADIYALGICLFELATGKRYYEYEDDNQLKMQILQGEMRMPREADPELPRDLAAIIFKAIQKNPASRYASARDMAQDLVAFSEFLPTRARPPSLWFRGALFMRRHPLAVTGVASALAVVLLLAGGWWGWRWLHPGAPRVRVQLCAHAMERHGVLHCAHPVTPGQQRRRHSTYRFTLEHGKVSRVERINGAGFRTDGNFWGVDQDMAQCEYEYNQRGEVAARVDRTASGRFLQRWVYLDRTRRDRVDEGGTPLREKTSESGSLKTTEGAVYTREVFTYDERGCVRSVRFYNIFNVPQRNSALDWGYEYERDDQCLPNTEHILDDQGTRASNRRGLAKIVREHDDHGNVVVESYHEMNGQRWSSSDGCSYLRFAYDGNGNQTRSSCHDAQGVVTWNKSGYASRMASFDEQGNELETWFLDPEGQLVLNREGYAGRISAYNERGYLVNRGYYGVDKKLIINKDGIAGRKSEYDDRGNLVGRWFFGVDGKPTLSRYGIASWKDRYDERGNQVERNYFGLDERPVLIDDGIAGWKARYDERRNKVELWNFGLDGQLTTHKDGYAGWRARYDERGNEIERRFFGVDRQAALNGDRCAGWRSRYDEHGNRVERWYFGLDDRLLLYKAEYAGWKARFDERGNKTEQWYYGPDEKLILLFDGFSGWTARHDGRGNPIEMWFHGTDEKLILNQDGIAGWKAVYDVRGNEVERWYYDLNKKLVKSQDEHAGYRSKYDDGGNMVERWFYGLDEKLTVHKMGFAGWRSTWDALGNETRRTFLGLDGRPIADLNGVYGWKRHYNPQGVQIEERYLDENGSPVSHRVFRIAGWRRKLNAVGNLLREEYFDVAGSIAPNQEGVAWVIYEYHPNQVLKRKVLHGPDGSVLKEQVFDRP